LTLGAIRPVGRSGRCALAAVVILAACTPLPPVIEVEPPKAPRVTVVVPPPEKPDPQAEAGPITSPPLTVPPPAPAVADDVRQLGELVAAAQRFMTMSPEEQKRDYNAASQAFTRERSMQNRLRLALMLSTPGGAVQDDVRALGMLEGLPPGNTALRQLAALLQAQVAERARASRRADQLKEQLDALRAVERSIIERGEVPAPRKP
jgi:hypothetical protein